MLLKRTVSRRSVLASLGGGVVGGAALWHVTTPATGNIGTVPAQRPDTSADMAQFVENNISFGLAVLRQFDTENAIFSPLSFGTMFGMLFAGAGGETRAEIADTVNFDQGEAVHASLGRLLYDIGSDQAGSVLELRADRPFLFFIRNMESDAVLFLGQVGNPAT